ncbi:MAG: CBS domain-containing protein [Gammaproteobacteria bacterium]|nr:CBS domain-containing protein [Gammaproteobacteria bacterium]
MSKRRMPTVKSLMTPFPDAVDIKAPVAMARKFMMEHRIRHLPVTREGELIGIITDRDVKLALGPDMSYPPEDELSVEDVYLPDPFVVDINASLDGVLLEMANRHIGSALVTRKGKLSGILTTTDVCKYSGQLLRNLFRASDDEDAA